MWNKCPMCQTVSPAQDATCKCGYRFLLANIPEPLADPLRSLRKGLLWINGLLSAAGAVLAILLFGYDERLYPDALFVSGWTLANLLWLVFVTRLLPRRSPDVLYLRSFRTDPDTTAIRMVMDTAVGNYYRVSGIRQPKRRWPPLFRFVFFWLFSLRYSGPKYMNLEAGSEWRPRLWRSLGEAKGVVIDLADMTPAVEAEIRLCVKCMGYDRILFLGRQSDNAQSLNDRIDKAVASQDFREKRQVAFWCGDTRPDSEFGQVFKQFVWKLPESPAGFDPTARHLAEEIPDQQFRESGRWLRIELILGMILAILGFALTNSVGVLPSSVVALRVPWSLLLIGFAVGQLIAYLRNVGAAQQRRIAIVAVALYSIVLMFSAYAALEDLHARSIQEAGYRMRSSNNLKQMGLAMHSFNDEMATLPAANAAGSQNGKSASRHPVSWRVRLLPYLDDPAAKVLYERYRFDEEWDGPNNSQLIPLMPKVYSHPKADPNLSPGHTHYRVFGSLSTSQSRAVFTYGGRSPSLLGITDGTSNTLLIVEAADAVPWTMPEVLFYDRNQPLPKLGGLHTGGFMAALADGSVRFFRHEMPEANLRARITRDGDEIIRDE